VKVFISYRRVDLHGQATALVGRIFDRLTARFGLDNVFMDVNSIPYGEDFVAYVGARVAQADVLLAVIGPQWSEELISRAGEKEDFVRIEIEEALKRGIRVVPLLVGDVSMPGVVGLPETIVQLRRLNALPVDSGRDFHDHMERLIKTLEDVPVIQVSPSTDTATLKPASLAGERLPEDELSLGPMGTGAEPNPLQEWVSRARQRTEEKAVQLDRERERKAQWFAQFAQFQELRQNPHLSLGESREALDTLCRHWQVEAPADWDGKDELMVDWANDHPVVSVLGKMEELDYFQPSVKTLKRYLSTHKNPIQLGAVTLPGLFNHPQGVVWESLLIVALSADIATAAFVSLIMIKALNLALYCLPLGLMFFFGLDLVAAIFHHWPAKKLRCLFENQKLLVVPSLRSSNWGEYRYSDYLAHLSYMNPTWPKILSAFCAIVIISLAVVKTLFLSANIDALGELDPTMYGSTIEQGLLKDEYRYPIIAVFALLNGLIAFIHLKYTGWAISHAALALGLRTDRRLFVISPRGLRFNGDQWVTQIDLWVFAKELIECKDPVYSSLVPSEIDKLVAGGLHWNLTSKEKKAISPHSIEMEWTGIYALTCRGVLQDDQLVAWVNMQRSEFAKLAVTLYGHRLQLQAIRATDPHQKI